MKKVVLILFVAMTFGIAVTSVMAEEKTDHYEGQAFNNVEEAKETLVQTSVAMAAVLDDETLDVAKMEQVHETSYTTEDAVAYLDKETKVNLKTLAAKLEEVHLASEDHKADDLRRNYVAYQAELTQYLAR